MKSWFYWWHRKPRHVDLDWGMFTPEQRVLVETKLAIVYNDLDEMTRIAAARQQDVDDAKEMIRYYAEKSRWLDGPEGKGRLWYGVEPGYTLAEGWIEKHRQQK